MRYRGTIRELERLETFTRYWLEEKGMRKELKKLIEEMWKNFEKLDKFMSHWVIESEKELKNVKIGGK